MKMPLMRDPNERPLDNIVDDGGFAAIFRRIACVGDSLSSGEFEQVDAEGKKSYHDMYEYSWGQFIARMTGAEVFNFSRGGMTAKWYLDSFAEENGYWGEDKKCQAYIIALGVNDLLGQRQTLGTLDTVDLENGNENPETFAEFYGTLIARLRKIAPNAFFFLMTMPRELDDERCLAAKKGHRELLLQIAERLPRTYVLDFFRYAPIYDETFKRDYYLYGHLNPCGYLLTAKMVASYIDYIVRQEPNTFDTIGFIPH